MQSESRPGRCSYRNASLPCRVAWHMTRERNAELWCKTKCGPCVEASTSFDKWKALIVTRCFELGIAVAGIDEHLLYNSVVGLVQRI